MMLMLSMSKQFPLAEQTFCAWGDEQENILGGKFFIYSV
jgi:hypothetical protein